MSAEGVAEPNGLVLDVVDLQAGYGEMPVLHGISLQLWEGEAIGIVGHNGMGKTTLMKTIMGLLPAARRQDRGRRRRRDHLGGA